MMRVHERRRPPLTPYAHAMQSAASRQLSPASHAAERERAQAVANTKNGPVIILRFDSCVSIDIYSLIYCLDILPKYASKCARR